MGPGLHETNKQNCETDHKMLVITLLSLFRQIVDSITVLAHSYFRTMGRGWCAIKI